MEAHAVPRRSPSCKPASATKVRPPLYGDARAAQLTGRVKVLAGHPEAQGLLLRLLRSTGSAGQRRAGTDVLRPAKTRCEQRQGLDRPLYPPMKTCSASSVEIGRILTQRGTLTLTQAIRRAERGSTSKQIGIGFAFLVPSHWGGLPLVSVLAGQSDEPAARGRTPSHPAECERVRQTSNLQGPPSQSSATEAVEISRQQLSSHPCRCQQQIRKSREKRSSRLAAALFQAGRTQEFC